MVSRRCVRLPPLLTQTRFLLQSPMSLRSRGEANHAPKLHPRDFPVHGFKLIDSSQTIEEERLPSYQQDEYYPMRLGEVVQDRYQIVAKLGYGTTSTVWLSRDLIGKQYWALKVHIHTMQPHQELEVHRHLNKTKMDHPGKVHVRRLEASFRLRGPKGEHDVFVMPPLGMSLRTLQEMQVTGVMQPDLVMRALEQVFLGLSYLHAAEVIHTVEENEISQPSPRKQVDQAMIYVSQAVLGGAGPLTICDLGQARIGLTQHGFAMPLPYRAPEIILKMQWGSAVDAWSAGLLAWDLLEKQSLFKVYDRESTELNDAHHLAAMTALIGSPPRQFLERSPETSRYWNHDGRWIGPVPLPDILHIESFDRIKCEQDADFIQFLQCFLHWVPEERFNCLQGYFHPWLANSRS